MALGSWDISVMTMLVGEVRLRLRLLGALGLGFFLEVKGLEVQVCLGV